MVLVTQRDAAIFLSQALTASQKMLAHVDEQQLASTIHRSCREVANVLHHSRGIMEEWMKQQGSDLKQLELQPETHAEDDKNVEHYEKVPLLQVLQATTELMQDIEDSLLHLDQEDAQELATVATLLTQNLVASLQVAQEQLLPAEETRSSVIIEEIDDNNENDAASPRSPQAPRANMTRQRLLWPPLTPHLQHAFHWGHEHATQQPVLALGLGLTLWPAALLTTFFGAPVVAADVVAQHLYQQHAEAALVVGAEVAAAQGVQSVRLAYVTGRIAVKQSLRVAQQQIDRHHGGLEQMIGQVGHFCWDHLTHPVDTFAYVGRAAAWTMGHVGPWLQDNFFQQDENDASVAMAD